MNKHWIYKSRPSANLVASLSKSINVNPYLSTLLVQRGIHDLETAKDFFRPSLKNLHDPFLIKDMDKAVHRLKTAVDRQEKILIYGDYDVDGTTAVALVYRYLKGFYPNCDFYTPDRLKEGYGVSEESVTWAFENGFSLVVALDLGVKSVDAIAVARQKGIDFIVCDHHLPGDELPAATAVINPKRKDCSYPFSQLSGCGLGFKLIQAFAKKYGQATPFTDDIDLVAVSIAADIVPINGENRILAYHGLKKLNENPVHGLAALKKVARIKGNMDVSDVVFKLGPRINAAGRVAHAREAIELLVSATEGEANVLANRLDEKNELRRTWEWQATEEALAMIEANPLYQKTKSTVLYKESWNKGIIGIMAARCIENHYRPTIVLTKSNGKIVGSGRSIGGFDLYKAALDCDDLLEKFGGHKYAVGLVLTEDNLEAFKHRFEKVVSSTLTEEMMKPTIEIDMDLPLDVVNEKFVSILKQVGPFGPAHQKPVFVAKQVFSKAPPVRMKDKHMEDRHIRFFARQKNNSFSIKAVGFNMITYCDRIEQGQSFSMAFTVEENEFLGRTTIELRVKDIKFE